MKLSALIFVAALAGAGGALAQAPEGGPGGPAGPRPAPSPARQAVRKAMMAACQADLQTLCPGQTGRGGPMMCLRQNRNKLSPGCKTALQTLRPFRGRGPGRFGGPGGPGVQTTPAPQG